jgi:hypothetical protein
MDDFVAVTGSYLRCGPICAGKNLKIALDGDAFGANSQMGEQARHVEAVRNLVRCAVYCDLDWHEFHFENSC